MCGFFDYFAVDKEIDSAGQSRNTFSWGVFFFYEEHELERKAFVAENVCLRDKALPPLRI